MARTTKNNNAAGDIWNVVNVGIELAHSNTTDEATGFSQHEEICGIQLVSGNRTLFVAYRPSDYTDRNPGMTIGNRIKLNGLETANDTGYTDERDVWITDITFEVVP